jgi:phytoene dehydrogenase-like protein
MSELYDAIIIGGGHNGLVAAATLAQNGKQVLVLEKRDVLGGAAATEEIFPGFKVNTGAADAALFQSEIINKLGLTSHGLEFRENPALLFAPQPDGRALTIWRDQQRTVTDLSVFSAADAERYPAFKHQVEQMATILSGMMMLTPPDLVGLRRGDALSWGPLALRLRRLGGDDMMEFLRVLPMAVQAYLDEWFESDALKGALGGSAITGTTLGPRGAGTNLLFFYQNLGGLLNQRYVAGGIGELSAALAKAAQTHGATIRTGVSVQQIMVGGDLEPVAVGVQLENGEEIRAATILSGIDARHTLLGLVGPQHLEPEVMRQVRNIIYRGSTAKVDLALDGLPAFNGQGEVDQLGGRIRLSPSLDYLERAYDAAKYGRFSEKPYLEVVIPTLHDASLAPEGKHILSITAQYAPYALRDGLWSSIRESFTDTVLDTLEQYASGTRARMLHCRLTTPLDWEQEYGLTEGSIFQGQMSLDQLLVMRPIPGWSRYTTPVKNLYLCGSGAHPGGGVTGAPGYNAARAVLGVN